MGKQFRKQVSEIVGAENQEIAISTCSWLKFCNNIKIRTHAVTSRVVLETVIKFYEYDFGIIERKYKRNGVIKIPIAFLLNLNIRDFMRGKYKSDQ